jgi:hypothetical protein
VRDLHLKFNDTPLGKLTLSVGAATFPDDAEEADPLLKLADTALYAAKGNGRDQCQHTNPPSSNKAASPSSEPVDPDADDGGQAEAMVNSLLAREE